MNQDPSCFWLFTFNDILSSISDYTIKQLPLLTIHQHLASIDLMMMVQIQPSAVNEHSSSITIKDDTAIVFVFVGKPPPDKAAM